jgi:hypothetical protein
MARGTTLEKLLQMFHNEIGQIDTPSYGIGARNADINLLQRTQEWLWEDFDWPFLQVKEDLLLEAGSHIYDPTPNIPFDRIQQIQVKYGGYWQDVSFGIDEDTDYLVYDTDTGVRNDPVCKWDFHYLGDNEQICFWPIPASNADATSKELVARVTGTRKLRPLVEDSDRAMLDDRLITLFAAAESLARDRAEDAGTKLQQADKRYKALKANISTADSFSLGDLNGGDGMSQSNSRIKVRAVYGGKSGA